MSVILSSDKNYKALRSLIDNLCAEHSCTPEEVISVLYADYQCLSTDDAIEITSPIGISNELLNAPLPKPFPDVDSWMTRTGT